MVNQLDLRNIIILKYIISVVSHSIDFPLLDDETIAET